MTTTFTPQKRSVLRNLWDNWFHARLERRKVYLSVLIPETVKQAITAALASEKAGAEAKGSIKLPGRLGLSVDGTELFSRMARQSSYYVDALLVQLRLDNPDWYIYTDAHGYDTAYDTIIVRRKEQPKEEAA